MITNALLSLLYAAIALLIAPLNLLPNATINPNVSSALAQVGDYFAIMNGIFPIGTLLAVLGAVLSVEVFILTYKVIMWVIKKIPTIS